MAAKPVAKLTFEQALEELEGIVTELERGESPLEDAIARFERGTALARRCEDRLNEADAKIAVLIQEGSRVVEVDLATGETLSEREDPGEDAGQAKPAGRKRTPPAAAPRKQAPQAAASGRPEPPFELDDEDIPF